jgi:hypothetical protein
MSLTSNPKHGRQPRNPHLLTFITTTKKHPKTLRNVISKTYDANDTPLYQPNATKFKNKRSTPQGEVYVASSVVEGIEMPG